MNAIIVDDELSGRETLEQLLKRFCPEVTVIAMAESAEDGVKAIQQHNPDIVFLDVEMPNGTGFTLLEQFPKLTFHVIFVTAYQHYALKAIKFSALDYLLKPVDVQDLQKAVAKAKEARESNESIAVSAASKPHADSIAVPVEDGLIFLRPADIIRCESESNYTRCFLNSGQKLLVSRTLKEFEELLSPHDFMRVHNSHLLNLRAVAKYVRGKGGFAVLHDGTEIEVSPRKRDEFLECFERL